MRKESTEKKSDMSKETTGHRKGVLQDKTSSCGLIRIVLMFVVTVVIVLAVPGRTRAVDQMANDQNISEENVSDQTTSDQAEELLLDQFDFREVDRSLQELFPQEKRSMEEILRELMRGDLKPTGELVLGLIKEQMGYELTSHRKIWVELLVLILISAIFTNFSEAFQNRQISEVSFYILYLLMITICLQGFLITLDGVEERLGDLTEFMKVLAPSYCMAIAFSTGAASSLAFYNLVLLIIYVVNLVIVNLLLPMVHLFLMMKIMNYLTEEEYLTQFTELCRKLIGWILKILVGAVAGINIIQGMLTPAMDSLNRTILGRGVEVIPGIGNVLGGMTDVALASAVVIKNGIGMTGLIFCGVFSISPVVKMAALTLLYKLLAAVVEPVSHQRIVGCVSSISEGYELLLKIMTSTGLLFMLTLAVLSATTS